MKAAKVIAIALVLALFASVAVAQPNTSSVDPGITPDSPFYFFKVIVEKVKLFVIVDPAKKADLLAELINTKLAEAQAMFEEGKVEDAQEALELYQEYVDEMTEVVGETTKNGKDLSKVIERVKEAHENHVEVLTELLEKVPDQAKDAIEHALEVSQRGQEVCIERLEKIEAGEIPGKEVKERVRERYGEEKSEECQEDKECECEQQNTCQENNCEYEKCEQCEEQKQVKEQKQEQKQERKQVEKEECERGKDKGCKAKDDES